MALLAIEGFDAGVNPSWLGATPTTVVARTGTSSVRTSDMKIPIPATSMVIVGFAAYVDSGFTASSAVMEPSFLGDAGVTHHMRLGFNATGNLVARRSGTTVATSTQIYPTREWHYIEIKTTVADTGGIFVVRVDGQEWINFTGDTKEGGTSTLIDMIQFVRYTMDVYVDDLYICDATGTINNNFLGDHKVETLLPNGNGATNQWVGTDGNSTDNYLLVDENPANTTDYVSSSTVGQRDLYEFGNLVTATGSVKGVQTTAHAQKADAGNANIKEVVRQANATESVGASKALSTSWATVPGAVREAKPDGTDWTIADVNGAQFGVEVS